MKCFVMCYAEHPVFLFSFGFNLEVDFWEFFSYYYFESFLPSIVIFFPFSSLFLKFLSTKCWPLFPLSTDRNHLKSKWLKTIAIIYCAHKSEIQEGVGGHDFILVLCGITEMASVGVGNRQPSWFSPSWGVIQSVGWGPWVFAMELCMNLVALPSSMMMRF